MSIEVCSYTPTNIPNRSKTKMFHLTLCRLQKAPVITRCCSTSPFFRIQKPRLFVQPAHLALVSPFHLHFAFAFACSSAHLLRQQAARVPEAFDRYAKLLALPDLPTAYTGAALLALGRLHAAFASEQSRALCHTLALAAAERSLASFATCATPLPA